MPQRYARLGGVETLTCVPVSAGGRWLGVIFADRGGERFELTEEERHAMWTLGKTAALAASVRIATSQQGRARLLQARIDLARELHERVVQRLFGVSLVLGSEHALSDEARQRCASEMHAALADLREALSRPLAPPSLDTGATLRGELARLGRHYKDLPLELDWEEGVEVPRTTWSRWRSRCSRRRSATRDKHAQPSTVRVHVGRVDGTFVLEVRNDGVTPGVPRRHRHGPAPRRLRGAPARRARRVRAGGARLARAARGAGGGGFAGVSPDRNLRVLVVDDHDVVHWGFRLLLTEQPWVERCLTASSVEEALEMARRYEPHVALVDLFLGEESGAELCEAIRRESPAHARAADLGRRLDLAAGGEGGGRRRVRVEGLAGPRRGRWRCGWSGKGMTVFAPRAEQPSTPLSDREREVLTLHGERRDQQGDRRAALPLAAHREGAHERALPQAERPQPRRGRAARGAARPDGLGAQGPQGNQGFSKKTYEC